MAGTPTGDCLGWGAATAAGWQCCLPAAQHRAELPCDGACQSSLLCLADAAALASSDAGRRASKTALNQMTTCMVREINRKKQKICALLLHPGTVDTDLSKPFQGVRRLGWDAHTPASPSREPVQRDPAPTQGSLTAVLAEPWRVQLQTTAARMPGLPSLGPAHAEPPAVGTTVLRPCVLAERAAREAVLTGARNPAAAGHRRRRHHEGHWTLHRLGWPGHPMVAERLDSRPCASPAWCTDTLGGRALAATFFAALLSNSGACPGDNACIGFHTQWGPPASACVVSLELSLGPLPVTLTPCSTHDQAWACVLRSWLSRCC